MIRLVFIALGVVALWLVALQVLRFLKTRQIDWTGVSFAVGFVALAFYLRHITGVG